MIERIYFIYKYTFPNGKVYIGQTYKGSGRYGTTWGYKTQLVYRAMLKYKDFEKEILEYCDASAVDEIETFYIKQYDSMNPNKGYNRDTGGNERKVFSIETRKLISEAHDGQPILQFDLEANLLAEWDYIQLAAESLELDSKNISACLHGKTGQCGGYQWKFKDDPQIVGRYQEYDGRRKINQYDLDGHYIDTWDSIIDIYLALGINTSGIIKCCQFKRKKAGEYQWRYFEGNTSDISVHKRIDQSGSKSPTAHRVFQFDLYGSLIREWGSIIEAARTYGLQSANIAKNCNGERKHCGEYIWSFAEEPVVKLTEKEISLILSGKTLNVGGLNPMAKRVFQYEMNGEFIKEWDCVSDASQSLKINSANIAECASGRSRQSAGGFIWSYIFVEKLPPYVKNKPNNKGKGTVAIDQLTIDGQFIKTWNSITEASEKLGVNGSSISRVLKGTLNSAGGYKWKYK